MSYSIKNLRDVEDAAAKAGYGEMGEARFARGDLEAASTGLAYHILRPNKRQSFAHRHENAEEIAVVLSGSGRVKIDDDIVDIEPLDAIRLAPKATRMFEAGPEGLEILVFGPHHERDGELVTEGFWEEKS
jgi:mannose-6-phosphate isomerase-like protein (cupin superfamily)